MMNICIILFQGFTAAPFENDANLLVDRGRRSECSQGLSHANVGSESIEPV